MKNPSFFNPSLPLSLKKEDGGNNSMEMTESTMIGGYSSAG